MRNATLPGVAAGTVLGPGSVVSGRFQIENLSTLLGQIVVYAAKDQRTQRPVALWAVPPGLLRPDALAATRNAVKAASAVSHKDLVVPFGSSTDPSGTLFIATEPLGAMHVGELIKKKSADGHVHGPNAAYQLLAHAMNGLAAAHAAQLAHGAIIPTLLRVDEAGHVRLAGVGLVAPLVASGAVDPSYVAPEVRKGAAPTARSDVYSLGAMLYELCTGKPPNPAIAATSLVPGLPTTFDIIIENCLADSPNDRFESVTEMKGALASLVAPTVNPPPASEGLDVPIEFDLDIDVNAAIAAAPPKRLTSSPPPAAGQRAAAGPAIPGPPPTPAFDPASGHAPIGARISMVDPMTAAPAGGAAEPRMSSVDLKGLLDEATANDAPRWMFVRGGLDHGPLSARELIQAIIRNEVLEDDVVFNMDSGERRKLMQWPQYREFAEQAREKRKKDQHAREVRSAIAEDTVSTRAKSAVAVAAVFMAALIGVVYYKTLSPSARQARRQAELDDALARGQIRMAEGGLQVLEAPRPETTGGGGGGGGRRSGGGGGYAGSYEAAMNTPIEFNFGGSGPGGGTLSDREISAPLNASLGRFGSCATAEIARGGSARQVQMRIAVGGNGAPIGVTVLSGSGAFKGCVAGVVRGLRWRAFGGPRIGFAWGFSLQ